ncbi:MAG TPA: hypothetical protein VHO03_17050 [Ignavibacteriales bacterium]|nr:hypothetical protein [Ignavibacteriales bacterium]
MKKVEISTKRNTLVQADFSSGKGLLANMEIVYGQNLIPKDASEFNIDYWWTKFGSWQIANGVATNPGSPYNDLRSPDILELGKRYKLTITVNRTSGDIQFYDGAGGVLLTSFSTSGIYSFEFIHVNPNSHTLAFYASSFIGSVDNIELREVLVKDTSGLGNDLNIYGSPTQGYLGSLPILNFSPAGLASTSNPTQYGYSIISRSYLTFLESIDAEFTILSLINYAGIQANVGAVTLRSNNITDAPLSAKILFGLQKDGDTSVNYIFRFGNNTLNEFDTAQPNMNIWLGTQCYAGRVKNRSMDLFKNGNKVKSRTISAVSFDINNYTLYCGYYSSTYRPLFGKAGVLFIIPKALSDTEIQSISQRLLYLANSCGVWRSQTGIAGDMTDANFVGVHSIAGGTGDLSKPNGESVALTTVDATKGIYYDSANHLLYAPLPLSPVEPIVDAKADGSKVYALSKAGLSEFSLDTFQRLSHKADAGNNIALSAIDNKYVYVTDAKSVKLSLVNPSTGRTISYTRKASGSNYIHTYFVDGIQAETKTTANRFENPSTIAFPFFVKDSKISLDAGDYIIDDLIVDSKAYDQYQLRMWAVSDKFLDSNVKTLIGGVLGFSNENIYSVDEVLSAPAAYPPELITLAKANNDPTKEVYYTE